MLTYSLTGSSTLTTCAMMLMSMQLDWNSSDLDVSQAHRTLCLRPDLDRQPLSQHELADAHNETGHNSVIL